jgi:hypothetical protein
MRPIIIGEPTDLHVAAVATAVRARGSEPVVFSTSVLENEDYRLDERSLDLGTDHLDFANGQGRGWIRRLAAPGWRRSVTLESHDGAVRSSLITLLTGLIRVLPVEWLSPLEQLLAADNKVIQWQACVALDIPVPRTIVTSNRSEIPSAFGDRLVAKPLGPGSYRAEDGGQRVVLTTGLEADDDRLDALDGAPFIVQERLDAESHLRVVTVRDMSWVYESRETTALDWRFTEGAHASFEYSRAWNPVAQMAIRLARHLGVGFSSQDWIVTDQRVVFLDLNPGGQWLFLPRRPADATEAIAAWLTPDRAQE